MKELVSVLNEASNSYYRKNISIMTDFEYDKLYDELQEGFCPGKEYLEILNLATIAREILSAAIARKESVGAHYRED